MVSPPRQGGESQTSLPPTSQHPRRPPAHRSVSLLHSPNTKRKNSPVTRTSQSSNSSGCISASRVAQLSDSPSSLQPQGRNSSHESSNADKWFEQSNNDVTHSGVSYTDDEPPFFMRNSSSDETPPEVLQQRMRQYLNLNNEGASDSLPQRTGLMHLDSVGSSAEEFRGVIDDLTVENKKLKRRLKKYEKLHDAHLKDEKLFEVRVHGLPPEKKRELEETLRKFASSLGQKTGAEFPANGYEGLTGLKTASSQGHTNTDSAYASMSASGQGGSSAPSGSGGKSALGKGITPTLDSRRQNVHSYLHQMPEGLLPRSNPASMSERAKKKVVVKRLEQIFSGKGAGSTGHQQTEQQEEVSQLAARADRSAAEAQGHLARKEGNREASIIRHDPKQDSPNEREVQRLDGPKVGEQDFAQKSHPQTAIEQRPTRPLDLDPHRAQVPHDNIRYMRHLGFSPPYPSNSPIDNHGWVYLNLVVNMAQLHTVNVTMDFVRKALSEYSDRFEISQDGRKVRWKGHKCRARNASSADASEEQTSGEITDEQSPRKRPKLMSQATTRSKTSQARGGATARSGADGSNKFMYTPMFFHKDSTDEDSSEEEVEDDSEESAFPQIAGGESSAMTSSGRPLSLGVKKSKKKSDDDGPIIFYNNARFCTDLSGERMPEGNKQPIPYNKVDATPLGRPQRLQEKPAEKRGPLESAANLPEPMDLSDNPIPAEEELTFPPASPLSSEPIRQPDEKPIKLEVTGIGGVCPADNFAIKVKSVHGRVDQAEAPEAGENRSAPLSLPPRFANILHGADEKRSSRAAVHKQVVSSNTQVLPPSELPPALSYMPLDDDSFDDNDSDAGSEVSNEEDSDGNSSPPSQAPQPMDIHFSDSDDERGEEDDDNDQSDAESNSSLDLLAAARELDPEAVHAREREYDAHMAERLAEEIPAGSSAATAGGGSGFASPASGVGKEEYRRAKDQQRAAAGQQQQPASLKQARKNSSMETHGLEGSDADEDDDAQDARMSDVAV
ncbi:hypothetical protein D0869_07204 [Hortaea werneckii]|uniref:Frequency clock protein n=1 Tax=Hortaea werneckii TaxID=91943 RepID=A0A3M6YMB5_HORWE|nr:hypothetical protein KC324_g7224 [Hortaea werneckii]RMX80906.1 hypothetical protein D0869_07204 [Hortaea werneckii]RMY04160.1 hypothetical protein D0868_07092 [Hortaea werneckii]